MDIEEKFYNLRTNFYFYKNKCEFSYFVGILIYMTLIIAFVILTKEKFPDIYMNTAMKVTLFILMIVGIVFHYTMKFLFHAKINYTKYYDSAFSFLNEEDIKQLWAKISDEASQMTYPMKEPFMRTVTYYLKSRGIS